MRDFKYKMNMEYLDKQENLEDLLATASCGSPWFEYGALKKFSKQYPPEQFTCREERWAKILLDGGYIMVCDVEDEKDYKLTLEMLKKAWQSDDPQVARAKADILDDDYDIYDADAIIQCALFGEVLYG